MKILAVRAHPGNWIKVFRTVNTLLTYGVNILWSLEDTEIDDQELKAGTFMIPLDGLLNETEKETLQAKKTLKEADYEELFESEGVEVVKGNLSNNVNVMKLTPAYAAMYRDSGCFSHAYVIAASGFDLDWISGMEVAAGEIENYTIMMSGGGGGALKANINRENLLLASMGVDGAKALSSFVSRGGAYFGCCGGSYIGTVIRDRFMNWWHPAKKYATMMNVEDWHISEASDSGFKSPGQGMFTAENSSPGNPAMFGLPETFECVHWNGPIWNILEAAVEKASTPASLVRFKDVSLDNFTPSEHFNASASLAELEETGVFEACKLNKTTMAQGYFGTGMVILSGSHPEMNPKFGSELKRDDLWDSSRILSNATMFAAAQGGRVETKLKKFNRLMVPLEPQKPGATPPVERIREVGSMLGKETPTPDAPWLNPELYRLVYGLSPAEIYEKSLKELPELCDAVNLSFEKLDAYVAEIKAIVESTGSHLLRERGLYLLNRYYSLLGRQKEPLWYQGGQERFQGVHDLLKLAVDKAEDARESMEGLKSGVELSPSMLPSNPYTHIQASIGRLGSALKLLWVNEAGMEKYLKLWLLYNK